MSKKVANARLCCLCLTSKSHLLFFVVQPNKLKRQGKASAASSPAVGVHYNSLWCGLGKHLERCSSTESLTDRTCPSCSGHILSSCDGPQDKSRGGNRGTTTPRPAPPPTVTCHGSQCCLLPRLYMELWGGAISEHRCTFITNTRRSPHGFG